jgi:hypothetical protein
MHDEADFEQILPMVIGGYLPIGLGGIVLAALVASFMSTFDSWVHAGTAYLVNDVYKRYIHRNAPPKTYVYVSYACSVSIVIVGITFGFMTESISSITKWLVSMLFGGYTAPNMLKWHWWRFNGYGFFAGMLAGVAAAIVVPLSLPTLQPLYAFPIVLAISTIASVVGCLLSPPESDEILERFYLTVRPWGFWRPVYNRLVAKYPDLSRNDHFLGDMGNCALGIIWQTTIVLVPIYVVLREFQSLCIAALVVAVTSIVLKKSWYDRLADGDGYLPEDNRKGRRVGTS